MDQKSDAKVMPRAKRVGKTDVRYWADTSFHRKRNGTEDSDWTAQIQFLKRREQFPLGTPNKAAAAAKARDVYLSLQARGWDATLIQYKAKAEEPKIENSTVGDLIKAVSETASYRSTTFAVYCGALRRISAEIADVKGTTGRFAPKSAEHKIWLEKVDATPLGALTPEAIQEWRLSWLWRWPDRSTGVDLRRRSTRAFPGKWSP